MGLVLRAAGVTWVPTVPVMVARGKKAAQTRATGIYTFEQHLAGKPQPIVDLKLQYSLTKTSRLPNHSLRLPIAAWAGSLNHTPARPILQCNLARIALR